jgi:OPA family glycerol-3-phosphate transporter-like MFS transporter
MLLRYVRSFYRPAPHIERLPAASARRLYPWYRWRVMEATFVGYATFYLVRNNLSVVAKDIETSLGYTHSQIGSILAITAISYGLGKFLMGTLSDRSNPRTFMATGLLLTAVCSFAFGSVRYYPLHLALWSMNGFVQGMGWPPCGRSMGHWFAKRERGLTFSIWNTAHNVGGGVAGVLAADAASRFGGWEYAFYVPGALAAVGAVYLFLRLCDTPQSVGLPPIEQYAGGAAANAEAEARQERELSYGERLFRYVLTNKYIWLLAIANFFSYIARYSMLDWGPLYLREIKGATLRTGGWSVLAIEFGGIPSTILLGWVSDLAGGRRGMVAALCMLPIIGAFAALIFIPAGYLGVDMLMLGVVGLFIYPVINFIVIMALDLTSKKAIGTAAGFIGLFGYLGRTAQAQGFGRLLDYAQAVYGKETAWHMVLVCILVCTAVGALLLSLTWKIRPRDDGAVRA